MLQVLWPSPYSFLAISSIPKLIYQAPMTELTKTLFQNLINRLKPEKRKKKSRTKTSSSPEISDEVAVAWMFFVSGLHSLTLLPFLPALCKKTATEKEVL